MPSIKAYTQYETLAFCQSVAYHGSDTAAFEDISTALNGNHLIRDSDTYDQTRLTAAALQQLYYDLLAEEKNTQKIPTVNGDDGSSNGTNPRKRKLSRSPAPEDAAYTDEQRSLESLVDKLYARFREQMIKEVRQEEEDYLRLQAEIAQLEHEEFEDQIQQPPAGESGNNQAQPQSETSKKTEDIVEKAHTVQASSQATPASAAPGTDAARLVQVASTAAPAAVDVRTSPSVRTGLPPPLAPSHPPPPASPALPLARASQPPPAAPPPPQQSPGAFHRTLPIPSPQRPNYGPINPQHFQPGPQGQPMPVLPPYTGSPHMLPPTEYPHQKRGSASPAQGRGSPVPGLQHQHQQPYPGYSGYPQQPPWPHHPPAQQQYGQPPHFPNPPYYAQSPTSRPPIQYQTPHHPQYAPYPQSAPIHYQGQPPLPHAWPPPQPGQPYYGYYGSPNVTPVLRSDSRRTVPRARSSTPWKRRVQQPGGARPSSPIRPEREVSPISDTESLTQTKKSRGSTERTAEKSQRTPRATAPPVRGRQQASATPSAFAGSRSQSIASFASDVPTSKGKKAGVSHSVKAEPPGTPAPIPSDTEQQQPQRTTGRRGRARASTLTAKPEPAVPALGTNKRKRSGGHDSASPPPSVARQLPSPAATALTRVQPPPLRRQFSLSLLADPSLVAVTRNFSKTSQLLLNEINSHKLAGIFAKPLSERDAPGYKDLVLRPQDLKSIKAAISKGGKAALAAIEAFEERTGNANAGSEDADGDKTPMQNTPASTTAGVPLAGERAFGNGVYLVRASEDLVPPKAIVNSAQLELELVRMFANAVMFNPLPSSERGFGRSLRLRRRGGDVAPQLTAGDEQHAESSESDDGTPSEVGGIISDTREMFEDVIAMVRKWREAELERLGDVGEADMISSTPTAGPSKPTTQASGSGNVSATVSANPSLRQSESEENEDETGGAPSPPPASATGTARKRRRIAE
ncbi:hypothetical protein G647_08525 [Cladophialophora carrionii CBS 160.54]|uniref:Bromo domain-containing protein n=1 Tax=Cladophialophora carrionii CBS 160.54 TaxID=1279043 RepID=V9D2I2_9EURO|nr:uncharacterized protein G647_08525 [Cladophialophora carrionii CBS 160.54]ETI20488.1 hypothetical protein G647_08525 [Cladophialophora carrionii CBS 160.54]